MEEEQQKEREQINILITGLHDMCARYEITTSTIINLAAEITNTKNYYLKLIAQIRQEQEKSISSK